MNFTCDKTMLSNAIDGVAKAVPSRSPVPEAEGILLEAKGFQLTLTGYDLELCITKTIDANILEGGEIILKGKLLSDMIHRMPDGQISLNVDANGTATIRSGVVQYDIKTMNTSNYPDRPKPDIENRSFSIPAGVIRDMVTRTIYAVSTENKKPAHTGELMEITTDNLTIVALDGYRLAIASRAIQAERDISVIVPAKAMNEMLHLLPADEKEEVEVFASRRFVIFKTNGYTLTTRLIEGDFLNYRNVIPDGYKIKAVINSRDFQDSIERASLIIDERMKNPLRISFENGCVTVRCSTAMGRVVDSFEAKTEGDSIEIGFNNRYLLDALRNAGCEELCFEINGPLNPVKVLPKEGSDFMYLVLPVRFKND